MISFAATYGREQVAYIATQRNVAHRHAFGADPVSLRDFSFAFNSVKPLTFYRLKEFNPQLFLNNTHMHWSFYWKNNRTYKLLVASRKGIERCTTTSRRTTTSLSWRRATRCTLWRSATTDGTSVPVREPATSALSREITWRDCEEGRRSGTWTPRGVSRPRIIFTKALDGIVKIDSEFLSV